MTVEESVAYPILGAESDEEWLSMTSDGYGYTRFGPDHRVFAVTMFHEVSERW
jgi:hypothetical protein